ncbi:MAG: hypothetical protein D6731_16295 [Planctomycetota bacterium]|nr:MAG: hypothetical protein D6731_16295 [Planctomycetota bacterium]
MIWGLRWHSDFSGDEDGVLVHVHAVGVGALAPEHQPLVAAEWARLLGPVGRGAACADIRCLPTVEDAVQATRYACKPFAYDPRDDENSGSRVHGGARELGTLGRSWIHNDAGQAVEGPGARNRHAVVAALRGVYLTRATGVLHGSAPPRWSRQVPCQFRRLRMASLPPVPLRQPKVALGAVLVSEKKRRLLLLLASSEHDAAR